MSLLDGAAIAAQHRDQLAARGLQLGLTIIVVGNDPATAAYVGRKRSMVEQLGWQLSVLNLPSTATTNEVVASVTAANRDRSTHAVVIQLPLPESVDRATVLTALDPAKDADGLHPINLGRLATGDPTVIPATARGVESLLEAAKQPITGQVITVIGKGLLAGWPITTRVAQRGATVISCDQHTKNLAEHTRAAEIVISAAGHPGLVTADMVRAGSVVIDVGLSRQQGKLMGDVMQAEVAKRASLITPVPGGVGPMTVVSLLENVADLATSSTN